MQNIYKEMQNKKRDANCLQRDVKQMKYSVFLGELQRRRYRLILFSLDRARLASSQCPAC